MHVENILCSLFLRISLLFPPFEIQPIITLEGSVSYTFQREGINKVTVQVASGGTIMQDAKVITVKGEQQRRSSNEFNCCAPSTPPQSNGSNVTNEGEWEASGGN